MNNENIIALHNQKIPHLIARDEATPSPTYVYKLSSDILLQILLLLRDESHTRTLILVQSLPEAITWDWLNVTWVCKHWRNVALERPSLWTNIRDFTNLEKIRMFIERSRETEIDILFHLRFPATETIIALLEGHMWRVRKFRLLLSGRYDSVMPRLAELTERAKIVLIDVDNRGENFSDIPDNIPGVKLNSLTLRRIAFPWSSTLYHGLSELSFESVGFTLSQLKGILEHCPGLKFLGLSGIHPTLNGIDMASLERSASKIDLLFLEVIFLFDIPFSSCAYPFAISNINRNSRLWMEITDYPFHSPSPLPAMVLDERGDYQSICIKFTQNDLIIDSEHANGTSFTTIGVRIPSSVRPRSVIESASCLLSHPYWKTAETVTVSLDAYYDAELVDREQRDLLELLLRALPKITKRLEITFSHGYRSPIRDDYKCDNLPLRLSYELLRTRNCIPTKFPELELLILHNADFSTPGDVGRARYSAFLQDIRRRSCYRMTRPLTLRFPGCKGLKPEQEEVVILPL